jgi:hypothetical protein
MQISIPSFKNIYVIISKEYAKVNYAFKPNIINVVKLVYLFKEKCQINYI